MRVEMSLTVPSSFLVKHIFAVSVVYFTVSYIYLVWWHKDIFLLNSVVHENGRLTLLGSLLYFDHFLH